MKIFKKISVLTILAIAATTLASFSSTTSAMEVSTKETPKTEKISEIEELKRSVDGNFGIFDCYMDDIKYHTYDETQLLEKYDLTINKVYRVALLYVYNLGLIINDIRTRVLPTIEKEQTSNETYQKLLEQFAACFEKFIYGNKFAYNSSYKIDDLLNKLINKYENKNCSEYDDYIEQFVKQYPDSDLGQLLKYLNNAHKCNNKIEYKNYARLFFKLYNKYFKKHKEFDKLGIIIHNEYSIKKFDENIEKHINLLIDKNDLTKEETFKKYEDMQEILTNSNSNIHKNLLDLKYYILTQKNKNKSNEPSNYDDENLINKMEKRFQNTSDSLEKISSELIPKKEPLVKKTFNFLGDFLKDFLNNNEESKDNELKNDDKKLKDNESKNNNKTFNFQFLYDFINNDESEDNNSKSKITQVTDEYDEYTNIFIKILKNIKTMHRKIVEPYTKLQKEYFKNNKVF